MQKPVDYRALVAQANSDPNTYVQVERNGAVATVTMDNPKRLNSLTPALCYQLHQGIKKLTEDLDIRVVILTGSDPAFCAGGDLEFILQGEEAIKSGDEGATTIWRWIRYQFGGVVRAISQSDQQFIAAINGPVAGVGLAFALACDHILASERASLVTAFGKIGLVPEVGTSWLLTRRIGYHKTMELFLHGEPLNAEQAEKMGLVNRVVPHAELLDAAQSWAEKVCRLPENVTAMAKAQLRKIADMSWEQALVMEEFAEPICFTTEPHRQAVRAVQAQISQHKNA